MSKLIDLTGQKFGRLTVVERAPNKGSRAMWLCRCDCSTEDNEKIVVVAACDLKRGHSLSCGCKRKETNSERLTKHGKSHDTIYHIYNDMKARCYNPRTDYYYRYGERGVIVCERWMNSFEAFYEDVSKLPHFFEEGYSLNRIDNDGNYEPGNVEWADPVTQANNRCNNRLITYNGETHTQTEWATIMNIPASTLKARLNVYGWTVEKSLTTPVKKMQNK